MFYWDPDRVLFTIPYFNIPVMVYGAFFSLGFILAYFALVHILKITFLKRNIESEPKTAFYRARNLVDSLVWYVLIGTIVGARLGDVLFYDLDYFLENPLQVFNIRQGGLASHGGAVGILLALWLFVHRKRDQLPGKSFLEFLDYFVIVVPLAGMCIRFGNFFNQEILGKPTNGTWGVIFGHPFDRSPPIPRHPVQLYEAAAYLAIFFILYAYWRRNLLNLEVGKLTGWMFVLLFGARFVLEYFKTAQTTYELASISMGQLLSLPFVVVGAWLIVRKSDFVLK